MVICYIGFMKLVCKDDVNEGLRADLGPSDVFSRVFPCRLEWLLEVESVEHGWIRSHSKWECVCMCVPWLCAFIPLLYVGELRVMSLIQDLSSVNVCVCLCAVVFVGMQQANDWRGGHASSVIACRAPPHFSMWKINGMLFVSVYFPTHADTRRFLSYSLSFHLMIQLWHIKQGIIGGFCALMGPLFMWCCLDNHVYLSEHNL